MSKRLIALCAYTLLTLSLVAEPIKIGIIGPFTGDMASLGEDYENAAMMAIDEIEEQTHQNEYEFIFEDDLCQNRLTALAAKKLLDTDKVRAIITFTAGPGNVIKPMAKAHNITHLNVSFDTTIADGVNNFTYTTPPQAMAKRWATLAKEKGWKKVVILEEVQQGVKAAIDAATQTLEQTDIEVVRNFKFVPGQKDFRTLILKAQQEQPDVILVMALLPEIEILGQQLRQLTPKTPVTSIWAFDILRDYTDYQGALYVSTGVPTDEFLDTFSQRYKYVTEGDQLNSYDMLKILVEAFESGANTTQEIADYLKSKESFDSLMGEVHCDESGVFYTPTSLKKVTATSIELLD